MICNKLCIDLLRQFYCKITKQVLVIVILIFKLILIT